MSTSLFFESNLLASPETVWGWITSLDGISKEIGPILRMSSPDGIRDLSSAGFQLGAPMFRSWITLFGAIPIDYSDLTLIALTPGVGFVEQSKMGSMRLWRHERQIHPLDTGCRVMDTLIFKPRAGGWLVTKFVTCLFLHRHKMLRKYLGGDASNNSVRSFLSTPST